MEAAAHAILRRERPLVALILLVSILLRIWVVAQHPMPAGDGISSNIQLADNINSGRGFSTWVKWNLYDPSMDAMRPEANRQPLLPLMLSLLFLLTGRAFLPAQLLAVLIGVLCMMAVWCWARKLFGSAAAMVLLFFLSFNPPFLWYSTQPDSLLLYTALVFLAMAAADTGSISPRRSIVLGAIAGLAYLARTQGLILWFSLCVLVLVRGGKRRLASAALMTLTFLVLALPWFIRNTDAFGSPLHSQNSQFLLNENHWSAWSVRETPPGPADLLEHQGPLAVAGYVVRGLLRVLEPVTTGSLHRGEMFGQPSLAVFLLFSLLAIADREERKRLLVPLLVLAPLMAVLSLHEHSGRYLTILAAVVLGAGSAGLLKFLRERPGWMAWAVGILLILPFVRPVHRLMTDDTRQRRAEAEEVALWIRENSGEEDRVVTYPGVELLVWIYQRPTLTMPNDYEMLLWPCLEEHSVRYVVIDPDVPVLRPWLSARWRRTPDGTSWHTVDPPAFLTEVYRTGSGNTIVYEMTGQVPEGFMLVDSLPPDNWRALPPAI